MFLLDVLFYLQLLICILAIFFNALLIYLVTCFTDNQMGFYKWIVVSYAVFEVVYAFVILLGMPVHIVAYGSWMAYNYGGILAGTRFSYFGPALYCSFYEMWLGFLALHFIYRYVVVSLPNVSMKIEISPRIKIVICLLILSFIGVTLFCSFYMCTRQKLTDDLRERVESEFGVDRMHPSEYILLQAKDLKGDISTFGLITIANHHFLVIASFMIMFFCSYNINLTIGKLRTMGTSLRRIRLQRQLFLSLLLQTLVPVIFCHLPSIVFLSFPFLEITFSFGSFSLLFTFLTSIEKVIDPIIVMFCISDCRRAVKNRFSKVPIVSLHSNEQSNPLTQ